MRSDLFAERLDLADILKSFLELTLRLEALILVNFEAESIFDHALPAFGRGGEDFVRFALRDDVVTGYADMSACQKLHDIFETHLRAVNGVFVKTVAMHYALDSYLGEINIGKNFAGVIEDQFDRSTVSTRFARRAVPDQILAALATHALDRLLTEDESERLCDIGLT